MGNAKFPIMLVIVFVFLLWMSGFLGGCKDPGQHLGNFKNWCAEQKGELLKSDKDPTDYMCKLPDGSVKYSK